MIERVVAFSARNRWLVLALAVAASIAGAYSMRSLGLDVFPDVGDRQVVIRSTWEQSADRVDAQVTTPIVAALLGTPGVRAVRGQSDFGASFVYVLFDDATDRTRARSRTLEMLSTLGPQLPDGVRTGLGPDATALGWVFQYVLHDSTGRRDLAELRSLQDWTVDRALSAVPGVAEVAPVGGPVRQYQVSVDPDRLRAYGLSIRDVVTALERGNRDAGGRVIDSGGAELVVRGLGRARSTLDLAECYVGEGTGGTRVRVRDVADVTLGSEFRRGVTDLDGVGEVVSGIVVMRGGENALKVIERVKRKLEELRPSLPRGVAIVPVYDRSELIHRAIHHSVRTTAEVMVTVALVILLFLWHIPSAVVPMVTIPLAVLIAFIPLRWLGIDANIMSLGGITIAIGALVDAGIVVVEQAHRRLSEWTRAGRPGDSHAVILAAIQQVARPSCFALLVIAASFLPVLALEGEAGRMFRPLAVTKTLAMLVAALLAITLDPALRLLLARTKRFEFRPQWLSNAANTVAVGTIHAEDTHPFNRALSRAYEPVVIWALAHKAVVLAIVLCLAVATVPAAMRLGSEFMPPFNEGTLLYMPTTAPGISVAEAQRLLAATDREILRLPEVRRVLGKAGRAETATDPAPLSMFETLIVLRPEAEWRPRATWYSAWAPEWTRPVLRRFTRDRITQDELIAELDQALRLPGLSNAWTMPVRGRLDMLSTGMRTPLGLKVMGPEVREIERIGARMASVLEQLPATRSAYAERSGEAPVVDIEWDRPALARHGLTIEDAQAAVEHAIGGDIVSTVYEGRERYSVNVRYPLEARDDVEALRQVAVATESGGRSTSIGELAQVRRSTAPAMIRNDDGQLASYVTLDVSGANTQRYIEDGRRLLEQHLKLPAGYSYAWSGQYEAAMRARERLWMIVPATLLIVILLLWLSMRSIARTLIVLLAVPFSLIGAIWMLAVLGFPMSIAVWVGMIALVGIDAETGVFMLMYLDQAFDSARRAGRMNDDADLRRAVVEGAAGRLRPKSMTVAVLLLGLLPVLWSTGTGADVMKRIAAPLVGGIVTSFLLELLVYPVIFHAWKSRQMRHGRL